MDQRNFTRKGSNWNSYGPKELYKKKFRLELLLTKGTLQEKVQTETPMDQRNFTRKYSYWNFYGPKELYKKVFRAQFIRKGSDWNSYGPKKLYKKRFRLKLLWIKGTLQESIHTGISMDQRNFIRKCSERNS